MSRFLISADSHVFEPVDLWQDQLPDHLRERAPRREVKGEKYVIVCEGMPPRYYGQVGQETGGVGGFDLDARLRDLEVDGVSGEVIYPTIGLFLFLIPDPELAIACARVYNDWCAEVFLSRPDVFAPAAIIPIRDVQAAAAELERVAELGYRTALLPTSAPDDARYNDEVYEPVWKTAESASMPLSFHVGTGALPVTERGPGGAVINYVKVGLLAAEALCYFAASGVLERHPDLHVAMVESGAGWLGYACERMDEAFEEHEAWVDPKLAEPPSHYVRRQARVTLGADRAPILCREVTGVEVLMWASDYPHPEGTWPESQAIVERIFAGLSDDEVDAIAGGNAAALYGLGPAEAASE